MENGIVIYNGVDVSLSLHKLITEQVRFRSGCSDVTLRRHFSLLHCLAAHPAQRECRSSLAYTNRASGRVQHTGTSDAKEICIPAFAALVHESTASHNSRNSRRYSCWPLRILRCRRHENVYAAEEFHDSSVWLQSAFSSPTFCGRNLEIHAN